MLHKQDFLTLDQGEPMLHYCRLPMTKAKDFVGSHLRNIPSNIKRCNFLFLF